MVSSELLPQIQPGMLQTSASGSVHPPLPPPLLLPLPLLPPSPAVTGRAEEEQEMEEKKKQREVWRMRVCLSVSLM